MIFHALKFCDTNAYDIPVIRDAFKERGIPVLFIDSDYTTGGIGQLRTRIEAFLEMLNE